MQETPKLDTLARDLAEAIHSAYAQQATGTLHPQHEQALLARLAEALRPAVGSGSGEQTVSAANAALDAWEEADPGTSGPRIAGIDLENGTVTLARQT